MNRRGEAKSNRKYVREKTEFKSCAKAFVTKARCSVAIRTFQGGNPNGVTAVL